jgi:hypothetical protein
LNQPKNMPAAALCRALLLDQENFTGFLNNASLMTCEHFMRFTQEQREEIKELATTLGLLFLKFSRLLEEPVNREEKSFKGAATVSFLRVISGGKGIQDLGSED